jgi:hypothetical protein
VNLFEKMLRSEGENSKGGLFVIVFFLCSVLFLTLLHLPPLIFHCVGGMLGSNPGLLRLGIGSQTL